MYVPRVIAQSIAVSGTGATAETTITVASDVTFEPGCIYDIELSAQIPAATAGTIITVTNGTEEVSVYQARNGNYARARDLESVKSFRVQFFADPDHFNLINVRR